MIFKIHSNPKQSMILWLTFPFLEKLLLFFSPLLFSHPVPAEFRGEIATYRTENQISLFAFSFPPPQEIQLDVNPQALSFRSSLSLLSYNDAIPEDLSGGRRSLATEKCPVLAVFAQ